MDKVVMSVTMQDSITRWTATRKTALVVAIMQGKTTVADASRAHDISPPETRAGVDDAKRGMKNALLRQDGQAKRKSPAVSAASVTPERRTELISDVWIRAPWLE